LRAGFHERLGVRVDGRDLIDEGQSRRVDVVDRRSERSDVGGACDSGGKSQRESAADDRSDHRAGQEAPSGRS